MTQFDNVIPIWGIQREKELDEWLSFMDETPRMDNEITAYIEKEKQELVGDFCRGCGYCMPCPAGIMINQCARMSLMLRRAPSKEWLTPQMQEEMKKIENCKHCGACIKKCPYELDTPALLEKNYDDYKKCLQEKWKYNIVKNRCQACVWTVTITAHVTEYNDGYMYRTVLVTCSKGPL